MNDVEKKDLRDFYDFAYTECKEMWDKISRADDNLRKTYDKKCKEKDKYTGYVFDCGRNAGMRWIRDKFKECIMDKHVR